MTFDIFSGFQTLWNEFNLFNRGPEIIAISLIGILIFAIPYKMEDKLLTTNILLSGIMVLGLTSSPFILTVNSVIAVFTVIAQVRSQ